LRSRAGNGEIRNACGDDRLQRTSSGVGDVQVGKPATLKHGRWIVPFIAARIERQDCSQVFKCG
jgi:hypothetical protein